MKRVVVTGGAGFVGSHLVRSLLDRGIATVVVDNFSAGRHQERIDTRALYVEADIRDFERVARACEGADVAFHLAAVVSVEESVVHPLHASDVNIQGTLSMLEAARQGGIGRFVFMSSAAVYGNQAAPPIAEQTPCAPASPYGLHKYAGEEYVRLYEALHGISGTILRPFNIYGPGQKGDSPYSGVISKFFTCVRRGLPPVIQGDGTQTRDFVHVHDVVSALLLAAESPAARRGTFVVGTGAPVTIEALAQLICELERVPYAPEYCPARDGDIRDSWADPSLAKGVLGWSSKVSLKDGLKTLGW